MLSAFLMCGSPGTVLAAAPPDSAPSATFGEVILGKRFAGTYLVSRDPTTGPSRILTIFADGNLSSIQSIQTRSPVTADSFTNQHGTWKWVGTRKLEATVLDFTFDPPTGNFGGTAIAVYWLTFTKDFETLSGEVEGKIFAAGVDPLDPGNAQPIATFTDRFEARRVHAVDANR